MVWLTTFLRRTTRCRAARYVLISSKTVAALPPSRTRVQQAGNPHRVEGKHVAQVQAYKYSSGGTASGEGTGRWPQYRNARQRSTSERERVKGQCQRSVEWALRSARRHVLYLRIRSSTVSTTNIHLKWRGRPKETETLPDWPWPSPGGGGRSPAVVVLVRNAARFSESAI